MQERRLIIFFFIYLVLEGALRKWVLPQFSTPLFLVKNLLMALVFLIYVGRKLTRMTCSPLNLRMTEGLCLAGWVFFTSASLFITGFKMTGVIGLSYYLIMLPLIVVIPRILRDTDDLERLCGFYLWIAVAVCLLGILQFNSPPDSILNRYAWRNVDLGVATLAENRARITGTFSYISPYASFLQFMLLVGLGLLVRAGSDRARVQWCIAVFLIMVNIVMTGSRGPFLLSLVLAVPFFNRFRQILKKKGGGATVVLNLFLMGALLYASHDVFNMLAERNRTALDSRARISGALFTPVNTLNGVDLVGKGVGSTFMGVRETGGSEEESFDEVNADRLGIELGLFGYLLVLFFKFVFIGNNWKLYFQARDQGIQVWALVALCGQLMHIWQIPVYSAVAAAYYFGCIGLYIFLRNEQARLDSRARAAVAAA